MAQENGRGLRRLFAPRKVLWYVRRRILFFVGACRVECGASSGACRPMGRSHFSFGGERKVCKRKPAARRLREKALYCPFLKEGVRNVARRPVSEITHTFVRARAHSFPLSKRARLFPSAAYRRSAPPQSAWGIRTPCKLGCLDVAGRFCGADKRAGILIHSWWGHTQPLRVGMLRCDLDIFATLISGREF